MTLVLTLTHLLAFLAGVLVTRWAMIHYLRVREIDGHTAIEVCPEHDPPDPPSRS